jgi:hypothetical protein
MRAPDRDLSVVVAPIKRRRGQHKSMTRYLMGVKGRMLRIEMEFLKIRLRNDPAERQRKREMRRNGDAYVLNRRVAEVMRERMDKRGEPPNPTAAQLETLLSREDTSNPHDTR